MHGEGGYGLGGCAVVALILAGAVPEFAETGDGYGYGSGSGYGSGYGSGSGDGNYWCKTIQYFAGRWTSAQRSRLAELQKLGAKIAFWRSNEAGDACNGGALATPVSPGVIHKEKGPLRLCERGTLHATLIPPKWKGSRVWIVALLGAVVGDDEKYGALEREIIGEAL
jgi:hypothetical protein